MARIARIAAARKPTCEQPGHHRIGHIAANGFATDGGCQRTGEERDEPNSSGDFPEEAAQ
jgi:hypothetical protein